MIEVNNHIHDNYSGPHQVLRKQNFQKNRLQNYT